MAPSIMASQALMVLVVFVAIKFRSPIGNAINKLISMVIKVCLSLL